MPSITRRRLLGGGAVLAAASAGTYRLHRGATDATFASWTPRSGTWPLRRYDPANTAHNPNASPPRASPTLSAVTSAPTAARRPRFFPVVGPDHVALYGSGFTAIPRGGGTAVHESDVATPLAGFGPDGRLHTVGRGPDGVETPSAVVGYGADGLGETYRVSLDVDHPTALTVGVREVYVGAESGTLRAVDPASGRRWHVDGPMPALANGRLYAADAPLDGTVAYAQRTGIDRRLRVGPERRWRTGTDYSRGFPRPPAAADGRLVQGSYAAGGGAVVACDADSGERLWGPRPLGIDVSTPAVAGDRGYVAVGTEKGTAGVVAALDMATGETVWRDAVDWSAFAPAVGGETLVVAGESRADGERTGRVRAYDAGSGDVLWTHAFEAGAPGGIALVEDRALVTVGASLYELR
ncbi:MAG: PQQ-binding-like beta-propeller repeat protein [Haloplanus sp.]